MNKNGVKIQNPIKPNEAQIATVKNSKGVP